MVTATTTAAIHPAPVADGPGVIIFDEQGHVESIGAWLLIYGTPLSGAARDQVAVIIQPATPNEVAPLVALAYGLTERETEITRLCMQVGRTQSKWQTPPSNQLG
jgi:hypothetical protein